MLRDELLKEFYKISRVILKYNNIDNITKNVFFMILESINADRGLLLIKDKSKRLTVFINSGIIKSELERENSRIHETIQKVENTKKYVIGNNIQMESFLNVKSSIEVYDLYSLIAIPIIRGSELYGIAYFDTKISKIQFNRNILEFVQVISMWLGLLIQNQEICEIVNHQQITSDDINKDLKIENMILKSPESYQMIQKIKYYARNALSILFIGENGVGKQLIANIVHNSSVRAEYPFVVVDCSQLNNSTYKNVLFGGKEDKIGILEKSNKGTILFKYIDKMPFQMQKDIIDFIERGVKKKLSKKLNEMFDIRFMFSNINFLDDKVKNGTFLSELYFKLKSQAFYILPLRERKEDIESYILTTMERIPYTQKIFTKEAFSIIRNYEWKGNYDELRNVLSSAILISKGKYIGIKDLPIELQKSKSNIYNIPVIPLREVEKETILRTLKVFNGNRKISAHKLGLSLRALQYKIKQYSEESK